ncbi:MAG TPA: hypothetical protein VN776_01590 [Terracidiphilus sp.]|nr:hypothetical protein [Terracidiphilus sp.]
MANEFATEEQLREADRNRQEETATQRFAPKLSMGLSVDISKTAEMSCGLQYFPLQSISILDL